MRESMDSHSKNIALQTQFDSFESFKCIGSACVSDLVVTNAQVWKYK